MSYYEAFTLSKITQNGTFLNTRIFDQNFIKIKTCQLVFLLFHSNLIICRFTEELLPYHKSEILVQWANSLHHANPISICDKCTTSHWYSADKVTEKFCSPMASFVTWKIMILPAFIWLIKIAPPMQIIFRDLSYQVDFYLWIKP